jgi:predicted PurR-regulated permease PerM
MTASTPGEDPVLTAGAGAEAEAKVDQEPGAPAPDLTKMGEVLRTVQVRSIGITLLLVMAVLYTLYFARAFILPIVFAVLLSFLFTPIVRALQRIHIPLSIGAALVILAMLGAVGLGAYKLAGPAQEWMARAPQALTRASAKLKVLRKPVEQMTRTAEQIEEATDVDGGAPAPQVVVKGPSLVSKVFGTTQALLAFLLEVILLLYFLLAAGDLFLQKLIKVLPQFRDKKKAVRIARETEDSISTYLFTVAVLNVGEGVVLAAVLWLLDMPNPLLWGALAAVLEFIPYLGAFFMVAILTLIALTTLDGIGHALLVPASFLVLNLIQGNVISPLMLGRRLTLNPVAIFVGLAFWWWIWGLPGAFIAVPLIAAFKIFCDHIETLAPIGEFLGD